MAFDIKLGIVSKKRNSTKIATEQEMTKTVSVVLKENCSDYKTDNNRNECIKHVRF